MPDGSVWARSGPIRSIRFGLIPFDLESLLARVCER